MTKRCLSSSSYGLWLRTLDFINRAFAQKLRRKNSGFEVISQSATVCLRLKEKFCGISASVNSCFTDQ